MCALCVKLNFEHNYIHFNIKKLKSQKNLTINLIDLNLNILYNQFMEKSLKLENINICYKKNYFALLNFSYEFLCGKNYFIVGEEQSGKSTLCRFVARLEKKYNGKIILDDIEINLNNQFYKNEIGFIFGSGVFLERKTVMQNLQYAFYLRNEKDKSCNFEEILKTFDLLNLKNVKVKKISKFDKLKLCIARLSLRNLSVLILDEIFIGIEREEIDALIKLIKNQLKYKCLIISNECFDRVFSSFGEFNVLKLKAGFLNE